jgi:hypothetical protein
LVMAPDDSSLFLCLMPLLPETVTREWRFPVAKSVLVPLTGSNLEAQVFTNPSDMCHASRLCLPLSYLRCQDTFSAPSMVLPWALYRCLLSPPWAYWDHGLP